MGRIIGRLTSIGIGREPSGARGTPVAAGYWIPVRELDFNDRQEMADNESGYGNINAVQDSAVVKQSGEGSFAGKVFDLSEGVILRSVLGSGATSTQRAASGVYDHVFEMANNNQHLSMTVAVKDENSDLRFANAVVNSYELEAVLDDYVARTVEIVSKKGASASDTVAYTNENEFLPKHITAKMATVGGDLDAASATKIRQVNISIAKNAEGLQVLGNNGLDDVVNKQFEVTGSIEAYYDDSVMQGYWMNNTRRALRIDIVNTDVTIGSTHNPALRFEMPEIIFTNWERGFDNNDIQTQTIEFRAVLNLTAGKSITARLTNLYAGANYAA